MYRPIICFGGYFKKINEPVIEFYRRRIDELPSHDADWIAVSAHQWNHAQRFETG